MKTKNHKKDNKKTPIAGKHFYATVRVLFSIPTLSGLFFAQIFPLFYTCR